MTLLLTMLPFYLFGNIHCLGMCGPLVMAIGHHRFRNWYFLGRTLSFTLAGRIAGEIGSVLNLLLGRFQIPAAASFLFGGIILLLGIYSLLGKEIPGQRYFNNRFRNVQNRLVAYMMKDSALPTFLFGFFTEFHF